MVVTKRIDEFEKLMGECLSAFFDGAIHRRV